MTLSAQDQASAWYGRRSARSRRITQNLTPWSAGLAITIGDYVQSFDLAWQAQNSGITGAIAPTNAGGSIASDGVVRWQHVPLLLTQPPKI
jgi:hypothetical protein